MASRFIAVIAITPAGLGEVRHMRVVKSTTGPSLQVALEDKDLMVLVEKETRTISLGRDQGIILGELFDRATGAVIDTIDDNGCTSVVKSRGGHLIERYWGGYVAICRDPETRTVNVTRAPFGELPCYFIEHKEALILASDVGMLKAWGLFKPAIDWTGIAQILLVDGMRQPRTCLAGLRELPGGDRLTVADGKISISHLWTPWDFVSADNYITSMEQAVSAVRATTLQCVASRTSMFNHALLRLSGGLDSSILAGALASAGKDFSCFTLVSKNRSGDERDYAAAVARHLGVALHEARRDVTAVDVGRSAAAHLPRPMVRSFSMESNRLAQRCAERINADVTIDGGGGDNLFCSLQSVAPVADRLRTSGISRDFLQSARDIAELAQAPLGTVCWRAARRAWLRHPHYSWPLKEQFLNPAVAEAASDARYHLWLNASANALPGKTAHIALMVGAQSFIEMYEDAHILPSRSALMAQPLIELCLRIPSWMWFSRGQNRIVARRAFADLLPRKIAWRRSKGSPDSFIAELFEANRERLRRSLLGGALAAQGFLDPAAIGKALAPAPAASGQFARIMRLQDVEAWIRTWQNRH